MMGAHVIKNGLSRYIIDLMERGWLSLIALNGAGMIHDYEMATIGATSESVARYIRTGQFGLWRETGQLNEIAKSADAGVGLGEAVGAELLASQAPHRDASILAAGCRLGMPVTVHVSLGYDIIHEHPNADGAAIGAGSYRDFLVYAQMITRLEHGVMIAAGTAVMGPEVYLKALSMARNVASQQDKPLCHLPPAFSTCWIWAMTSPMSRPRATRAITTAPTRRSWCALCRMAAPAIMCRLITAGPSRACISS